METQIVRKKFTDIEQFEDFRSGSGRSPFAYRKRPRGEFVDVFAQLSTNPIYGMAKAYVRESKPCKGWEGSWSLIIRDTPCRVNGVTAKSYSSLLIVPGGIEFEADQMAGWEYNLQTDWKHLQSLVGWRTPSASVVSVPIDPRLGIQLRDKIIRGLESDEVDDEILVQAFAPFAVKPDRLITPARERLACRARDFIDASLASKVCLSRVCDELGVSIRTVERAFRIRFQETMSDYVKRARLERARDLLRTGMTVTDAALDVGWTHLGRFSVEFKKRFGESPTNFKGATSNR